MVGRAAIFYYVLTTRRWIFKVFFFGGEDEFKETRKRCWILKFYQGFIWRISTILMEARVKIEVNQSARRLIDSMSTFPLRIWTLEGLLLGQDVVLWEQRTYMKASLYLYIYIPAPSKWCCLNPKGW